MARYRKESSVPNLILGAVGLALILVLGAFMVYSEDPPKLDKVTLCPVDKTLTRTQTAVILDRTEGLNAVQKQAIRIEMRKILEAAEPYERVALFEIVGRASVTAEPLIALCNPTRPWPTSKIVEKLDTDDALASKAFRERFLDRVMSRLEQGLDVPPQQDSPIMEVLQAVSVHGLKSSADGTRKRVLIYSDMMQHSPEYSHYRERVSDQFFKTPFFKKVATDLQEVDVRVFYINRAGGSSEQPPGHLDFWKSYFSYLGASTSFVPIEGAGWVGSDKAR